ncbi:tensin-2 isoform X2 [Hyperolius riggenbachi]|uniref:tensin-2 isoform X2 n=1 Tax=Hyperolius riggenbachi TaxID=752182 RepID=UPI0035A28B89
MLSLQCVLLPVIPALQTNGGFCPFLKIYQSMQLVYTSGIYLADGTSQRRQLCVSLEPALLLKGDIMVKCYHKLCTPHEREVVFRIQFHTCTIHNTHLCFSKDQLDGACTDERFPEDAAVEFIFSSGQDKGKGREVLRKDPSIAVDYDITDPLVRYDSYENLNVNHEDSLEDLSHTRGPLDGSLYARVKKKTTPLTSVNGSPEQHGRLLSVSSDSGHSSAPTERLEETPQKIVPTAAEREDLEKLLGGFGIAVKQEAEPQYSQVHKHEEALPPNVPQRQNVEGRPQEVQHHIQQEGLNQSIQPKVNGESRVQYSPPWSAVSDEGASQSLPLTSPSWEEQRESPCEAQWEGQGDRDAAILEDEMGQFGGLAMYPGRRPLLSRHCSCRSGYTGPNIDGPPNRSYFRTEGMFDPRGPQGSNVVLQGVHYPGMYGEQERRRLYRSLSEGPQHYPNQTQSPPKRGSLRENRQYVCQPVSHEPILSPLCPCSHCQSSSCYPVPNMWPLDGGKMPPVQHFHREQLPLHLSQTYGQPSHDVPPPFQVPPSKMHYGFSMPHGEDPLHFNHFTDGGYGHAYPHFLHPSYLPQHCPPNGYGVHSFPTCMSSYTQPGTQSPPGSVSPIVPQSSAPRRMSGDTMSASSTGELTPPQQLLQQDVTDHGVQRDPQSFQTQTVSAAPAVSSSSMSPIHGPMHSSTPHNSQGSVYSNVSSQAHSQSPVHSNVSPQAHNHNLVHSLSPQAHNQSSVHSVSPKAHSQSPVHSFSPQAHTQNSVHSNVSPQTHSQSPVHSNVSPQTHNQNLVHSVSPQTHSQSSVHSISPQTHSQNSVHSVSLQAHSPVNGCNTDASGHPQSPVHSSTPINVYRQPIQQQNNHIHTQSTAVQTQTSILVRSPSSISPTHRPALSLDHSAQPQNSPMQHNTLQKQTSVPVHSPTRVHFHSQVNAQSTIPLSNTYVQQRNPPVQSQSPDKIQNSPMQSYNGPTVQARTIVHPQSVNTSPHSPHSPGHSQTEIKAITAVHAQGVNSHSPVPPQSATVQPSQWSQAQSHQHNYAAQTSTVVRVQGAQANLPKQNSIHLHSPVCTEAPSLQHNSIVHTQSHTAHPDSTGQTHSTVHTQMPSLALHSPVPQIQSTVRIQSSTFHTFRNPANQGPPVPNNKPVITHSPSSQSSSPGSTDRSGVSVPYVPCSTSDGHSVNPQSPSHVLQTVPQMPVSPNLVLVDTNQRQLVLNPVCGPTEASGSRPSPYSVPSGVSFPSSPSAVPSNPVTPRKKSITIALPDTPTISPPLSPTGSQCDLLSPSPTPSFPISTAYYSGSPCPPNGQPPVLPEKCHTPANLERSGTLGRSRDHHEDKSPTNKDVHQEMPVNGNFVQDSSKFWYKPNISREQAIALLRGAEPGAFLIRDSNSFRGAYGLALKVASPPPNVPTQPCKDPSEQLVRHFLIETGPKGVKIKGSPIEPHFGSLSALVSQHSITPLSLPCRLRIPDKDLTEQTCEVVVATNMSTAADLLRQGAACSVLYLGSVDTESLTGPQAISKASTAILTPPRSSATTVHFKVSDQGVTLTDSQRKLFFRRHYPVSSVTYCSADPQDRRWTNPDRTTSKVFGFVARKAGTAAENVCHLFAELDPEQPASAIVNFVTKVMLGTQKR